MTTTDRAAAIRTELKRQGWTSRDISIRSEYYSLGSSIDIRVKNPNVPLAAVKAVAESHERIDRCAVSGEILSGCNRYVSVSYTGEACEKLAARYLPQVTAAIAALATEGQNALIPVEGTTYLIGKTGNGYGFSLWTDTFKCEAMDAQSAAYYVAVGSW